MAIDNLNFYSTWLPAGQLTDRYSSQPWCLRSKNLDIFSSSKSVKATAWSSPTTTGSDIIKQDGDLILKTDGKVYNISTGEEVLVVDPSTNFPSYQVSYSWKNWTHTNATRWTVQDLVAKYEWDTLKSFVVFTDRASYNYSTVKYVAEKTFYRVDDLELQDDVYTDGYEFKQETVSSAASILIDIESPFANDIPIKIYAKESELDDANISLNSISCRVFKYYYDAQQDAMVPYTFSSEDITFSWNITDWIYVNIPWIPKNYKISIELNFKFTKKEWASTYWWQHWNLYIDMNGWPVEDHKMKLANNTKSDWDYNEYYTYLPIRDRELVSVWDYGYSESFWMKGTSFQPLYKWTWTWIDVNWEKKTRYDFVTDMWWETDVSMDIVWMMIWNEQVYMIGNMDWNWYIIPCDLTWWRWTPYIAYGCEFKWATNIDYLMYLVWEDRWVSQLRVYNGQELVNILGGTEEKSTKNLIDSAEQYKFDWKMVNYRKDLILSTSDNRIFAYWQTYGGKWGTFIHELPWTITKMVSKGNDLVVEYESNSTKYITALQDDTPIKVYNTEWLAEYPIVLWNHLLEKEESDLYASYILPSASCSLEFWWMANHYHFWTFTSSDTYSFSATADYKLKGCTGNYKLKYIETNWNQYTFRLEGDLPAQTTNDMKITDTEWTELITYTEYNHFRKIWEITTTWYQEWEFRFHNLNNKLELPRSYSLQIMVKGKGTTSYTPELFALDLVANQRDRW